MSDNAKRAVLFLLFAAGLIFLIVGWTTSAYAFWTGVIVFHCFLFGSMALRKLWGLKRSYLFDSIPLKRLRRPKEETS